MKAKQDMNFSIRLNRKTVAKLEALAAVVGTTRSSLIRELVENFAGRVDELVGVLSQARKGAEAESVHAWAMEVVERAEEEAQLSMPTGKGCR